MELAVYILLGLIQGLTEFLPVSSSGHLVLAEHWLSLNPQGAITEVTLHFATLLSVVIVYRRDIADIFRRRDWHYLGLLLAGTIITAALVLPLRHMLAAMTEADYAVRLVGVMLLVTAAWLVVADMRLRRGGPEQPPGWAAAVWIGLAQTLAALPGLSRSGATIGAAVQCGISRTAAARFSFLLSVPVILGAAVITLPELPAAISGGGISAPGLALGSVAALLSGIAAIHAVLWLLKRARLTSFAIYCAVIGTTALVIG